jgi:hypothetical protein
MIPLMKYMVGTREHQHGMEIEGQSSDDSLCSGCV